MEKISGNPNLERIKKLAEQTRDKEYRFLYLRVSYALVKDGHIASIGPVALAVFFVIRTYADKNGISYPSLVTISKRSGISITSLQKEIKILVRKGWIEKKNREKRMGGKFGNNTYKILQRDLIRGSDRKGFAEQPLSETGNGE